ncbi:MAG: transposase [Methylobacter sp.]
MAPVAQRLVSSDGSYATYQEVNPQSIVQGHLDEVSDCIGFLGQQGFAKPLVHLIDREGDSISHIRLWEATGSHWLVRVKDNPKVDYKDKAMACKAVAQELAFIKTRQVSYHGKTYWQWVVETEVTLTRPAKPNQKKSKKPVVPGIPVAARLVVSRVLSEAGEVLAEWLILTNVAEMDASTIALGYYWRWQIECFFKLVKSAGHHLESWQQESALAIAKRLLVASMACVTVWAIAADKSTEAAELRAFLIKLSGRQMRHNQAFTNPSMLAGLWVFLSMFEITQAYSQEELGRLKATAQQFLGKVV